MGTLDFHFECIKLLQNDFCKQRYITLNATIPAQDRIYPKTHLCRTVFAEYIIVYMKYVFCYSQPSTVVANVSLGFYGKKRRLPFFATLMRMFRIFILQQNSLPEEHTG